MGANSRCLGGVFGEPGMAGNPPISFVFIPTPDSPPPPSCSPPLRTAPWLPRVSLTPPLFPLSDTLSDTAADDDDDEDADVPEKKDFPPPPALAPAPEV